MLTNIITLVLLPIAVLISFHKGYDGLSYNEEFFCKRQTCTVKGIMILLVYIHHFSQMVDNTQLIERIYRLAPISVAFFLFLSGYNTCIGHSKAAGVDYKAIWIKRCWRLYIPAVIWSFSFNWYLDALLVFWIFTDIAYALFDTKVKRLELIFGGNMAWVFFCKFAGLGAWWYTDVLTYSAGAAFFMYNNEIISFLKARKNYIVTLLFLILISIYTAYNSINYYNYDVSMIVFSFASCLVLIMIMMKLNPTSKLFYIFGQYSWEVFLLHKTVISIMRLISQRNSIVFISSFIISLVLGMAINKGVNSIHMKVSNYFTR